MISSDPDLPEQPELPALSVGRFAGREVFQQLVRDTFARAACEGWPEIILADRAARPSFPAGSFAEPTLNSSFTRICCRGVF